MISHHSCLGTSQQNDHAISNYRNISKNNLALIFSASFPKIFWGEASCIIIYTLTIIGNEIAFERLFGVYPDYTSLKVFGCACFMLLHSYERTK